ncbi:MAG: 6-pyruvoyl tetrahydropterin synthase family protein [Planctomycetota bacterium]|nr:6-pyruvoyl tetrahydropterin synthase family protein [Planctomycetota bacterium]
MFRLSINTCFSAAHSLTIQGVSEPVHGHDWQVKAVVEGPRLDDDGLLCDFHDLETLLAEIVGPFQTANLNESEAFAESNPSAEVVARFIGVRLAAKLPPSVKPVEVSVTEAPGCMATWMADS